jgi:hypothetical protein
VQGFPTFLHPEDDSPLLLPQDDDHAIHIDVHNEVALDDSQQWPVRQAMLMHIATHRQAVMAQTVQQAQMQVQMAGANAQATAPPAKETSAKSGGKAASPNAADVNVAKGAVVVKLTMPATKKTITTPSGQKYHVTEEPLDQTVEASSE